MRTSLVALVIAMATPFAASAQAPAGAGGAGAGWGPGRSGRGARLFDPATVTTLQGEILDVQRIPRGRSGEGVHLTVAAGTEKLAVHLGPSFFVDQQNLKLANGDRVGVKGSRILLDGTPTLIAQEITRGNESMVLRDESGFPLWAGARARGR
jgi:hypothetical protein